MARRKLPGTTLLIWLGTMHLRFIAIFEEGQACCTEGQATTESTADATPVLPEGDEHDADATCQAVSVEQRKPDERLRGTRSAPPANPLRTVDAVLTAKVMVRGGQC